MAHEEDVRCISLTSYEQSMLAQLGSVNSLHHFEGRFQHSKSFQNRLRALLKLNPYIAGRLISDNSGMTLLVPAVNTIDINKHYFEVHCDENPFFNLSCDQIRSKFQSCFIPRGVESVNKPNGILFRITIFVYNQNSQFSVITSLSHVLGDAHVHYQLLSMLTDVPPDRPPVNEIQATRCEEDSQFSRQKCDKPISNEKHNYIYEMIPERLPLFMEAVQSLIGQSMLSLMQSYSLIVGFVINFLFFPKKVTRIFRLNSRYFEQLKQSHSERHSDKYGNKETFNTEKDAFISTNDILMSELATNVFRSDFACLTLNLRSRLLPFYKNNKDKQSTLPHSTTSLDAHASNIIFPVVLSREELSSPLSVRQKLSSWSKPFTHCDNGVVPTLWQQLRMNGVFFASNWATVQSSASADNDTSATQRPLRFRECRTKLHVPLNLGDRNGIHALIIFDLEEQIHNSDAAVSSFERDGDSRKTVSNGRNLGIAVTTNKETLQLLKQHPMIGEELL